MHQKEIKSIIDSIARATHAMMAKGKKKAIDKGNSRGAMATARTLAKKAEAGAAAKKIRDRHLNLTRKTSSLMVI